VSRGQLEKALAAALDAEFAGYGYSRTEMVSVAFRRWNSFARRNHSKYPTRDQRVADLAKGLREHFDPSGYDSELDFVRYAETMTPILERA